jgi:hypothetical protein
MSIVINLEFSLLVLRHECCRDFQEGAAGAGADHVFIPTSVTSSGLPVTSSGLPVTLIGRPVIMTSEAGEGGGDEVAISPPNLIPNATSLLKPGGR